MQTRTKVIVINGVAGSGKDTFIELANSYCELNEYANVLNISSVDPIKDVLRTFGWDGEKTDEIRNLMVDIKKLWISAQNGPTMFLMNNILQYHMAHIDEDNIVFCHVREPEEINKLVDAIKGMSPMGIDIMTLLIVRHDAIGSDTRDSDNYNIVKSYQYDNIIYNNSDLPALDQAVCEFIDELF